MEPGGRQPAPGALRLVQEFINSVDREDGADAFAHPAGLAAWIAAHGLTRVPPGVTGPEHRRALALREALRAVLAGHAGAPVADGARAALDRLARESPLVVAFGPAAAPALRPAAAGVAGALGAVLAAVVEAEADGTWPRLKACARDSCRWAFYDRSRNRSGRWCAMSVCGTREKMATYRGHRGPVPEPPAGAGY
jgi:predicted RNA-binding Zn ribbon-like protein